MELELHGRMHDVLVPLTEENEQKISELMFRVIHYNAVAISVYNDGRQFIGRLFVANRVTNFEVDEKYARYDAGKKVPIHEVMRFNSPFRALIETVGTVVYLDPHEMYIRGEEACLKIKLTKPADAVLGNKVAAVGLAEVGLVSPSLRAQSIEVLEPGRLPAPIRVESGEEINPMMNYELIEIEATLIEHGKRFDVNGQKQPTLLCRSGDQLFEVRYPSGVTDDQELVPGSKLRLVGVCDLIRGRYPRWRLDVVGFQLRIRSLEDVTVLVPPPWWNVRRLAWVVGMVSFLAVFFLAWIFLLQRIVHKQTRTIADKVELETVQEERQRISRELHDTLSQGLVGVAIRLQGSLRMLSSMKQHAVEQIRTVAENDASQGHASRISKAEEMVARDERQVRESLQVVQDMLDHCGEESRSSILYLRAGAVERMELQTAIVEVLTPMTDGADIEFSVDVTGAVLAFNQEAERHLMLVVKEAVTNAIKHAQATTVRVHLEYAEDALQISIMDDGCGFDPQQTVSGHYGIEGMNERVKLLGGRISIESEPGKGACVRLSVPDLTDWKGYDE